MPEPSEVELKLTVVSGRLRAVARMLTGARFQRVDLDDVYFDTPDAELRRRGLVLRVRREGDRWVQTLKAASRLHHIVPERGEWEVQVGRGRQRPVPDLERFTIAPLRVLMRGGFDPTRLAPLFRSRVTRRRATLLHGASRIEVALDDGELRAPDDKRRRCALLEVELELKGGQPADLLDLARRLVDQTKGMVRLVPSLRTKAERGYALAGDQRAKVKRASPRGFAAELRSDMSAGEALRAVVRHGLAIVVANADALRDAPEPELVHQTRVALRRVRSASRLFDREHNDLPAPLANRLRWLARTLGDARDWDVLLDTSLPAIREHLDDSAAASGLINSAERERKRALSRATRAISSRRYAKLVLALAQWTLTPPPDSPQTLADAAAPLLDDLADRMFADARGFARLTPHQRHRVRIGAKRLRYALDLFAIALPGRAVSDYIDALAELQDTLGELNDAGVAVASLARLTNHRALKRALHAWHQEAEAAQVEVAGASIGALRRRSRPWSR